MRTSQLLQRKFFIFFIQWLFKCLSWPGHSVHVVQLCVDLLSVSKQPRLGWERVGKPTDGTASCREKQGVKKGCQRRQNEVIVLSLRILHLIAVSDSAEEYKAFQIGTGIRQEETVGRNPLGGIGLDNSPLMRTSGIQ